MEAKVFTMSQLGYRVCLARRDIPLISSKDLVSSPGYSQSEIVSRRCPAWLRDNPLDTRMTPQGTRSGGRQRPPTGMEALCPSSPSSLRCGRQWWVEVSGPIGWKLGCALRQSPPTCSSIHRQLGLWLCITLNFLEANLSVGLVCFHWHYKGILTANSSQKPPA